MRRTGYQVQVCMCVLVFFFSCVLLLGPHLFFLAKNTGTTADQNVTSPTSTQHSTGQPALHN